MGLGYREASDVVTQNPSSRLRSGQDTHTRVGKLVTEELLEACPMWVRIPHPGL